MKGSGYKPKVPAVEQASKVLLCLAKSKSPMNLTSICKEVGIHKSKGYGILNTLMEFGFVKRDPDTKLYSLGPALIYLAYKVLDEMDYKTVSEPFLRELSEQTNCAAFFGLIASNYVYVIAKCDPNPGINLTIPLGYRFPITYGAIGKAIFASISDAEREEMLKSGELYFHGHKKEPDLKRLYQEADFYRKNGFALDLCEMSPQFIGIASCVYAIKSKLVGLVFIVGVFEKDKVYDFGKKVRECAQKISYALGAKEGFYERRSTSL